MTIEENMTIEQFYNQNVRLYRSALADVEHKLHKLMDVDAFGISEIKARIKELESLKEKCHRKDVQVEDIPERIRDIAGARIICLYLDLVPVIVAKIRQMDGISVALVKDYNTKPKDNGYRGYHLECRISTQTYDPETLETISDIIPVEIQVRTQHQHDWAELEHKLRYKPQLAATICSAEEELDEKVKNKKLKEYAIKMHNADLKRMDLRDTCAFTKRVL
ncbi:MAG: hypothetical protein Q4A33_02450 [Candidatus Saccharibacteria bacterium]|nr:hypothetical protein [Candidatus Saccharibacteria bacterium]